MTDVPPPGLLERWFAAGEVREVGRLSGGYLNDVWRVDAGGRGVFALRLAVATTAAASVAWEVDLLANIAARGVPVARVVPALSGARLVEAGGRVGVLFAYLDGVKPDRFRREHRLAAAGTLAAIHRATEDFDAPPRPGTPALVDLDWRENRLWSWRRAREDLLALAAPPSGVDPPAIVAALDRRLEAVEAHVRALRGAGLPVGVIHGDYWAGNLRVTGDEVTGVFDWDDARHDWRALEVGRATWEFCRNAAMDAFDLADVDEFVEAYRAAGGEVLPAERAAFPVLIAAARITETLYDFALEPPAERSRDDWDYLLATLRLLDGLAR